MTWLIWLTVDAPPWEGQQWALECEWNLKHAAQGVSCGFAGVTHGMPGGGIAKACF